MAGRVEQAAGNTMANQVTSCTEITCAFRIECLLG